LERSRETKLVASDATDDGRARTRRVELHVVGE
jgi:outer membrane protein OmpA-like peptidoglycan-associated protein